MVSFPKTLKAVKKKRRVREADVEAKHRTRVKDGGGVSYKFKSPQRRSVPDRLDLFDVQFAADQLQREMVRLKLAVAPAAAYAIAQRVVAQAIQFTECKKPGEEPTPAQHREHAMLRERGFVVNIVDQLDAFTDLV